MHRSQVASNLLRQIQAEHEVDLLFISEQYNNPDTQTRIPDKTGTASIWFANPAAVPVEKQWQVQRLVLIGKRKGELNSADAYRPLCMLDTAGKLLEKIIRPRLQSAIQAAGGLSDRQYGFRPGLSKTEAVRTVANIAEQAQ